MHRKWLCIPAAFACLFTQLAMARNIFLTSGDYSTPIVATFSSDPLTFGANIGGLGGSFLVLPSASASKYYVISRSGTETVSVLEGRFPNLTVGRRISVVQDARAAAVTPDGARLLVVGPGGVQIIDTSNETSRSLLGSIDVGAEPIDVAASIDGTRAYVLNASRLTAIDLATNQVAGTLQIATTASAVSVGPNGVVYVSAQGAIYEIDGYSMKPRFTITTNGQVGKLEFTPNGQFALARNLSQFSGRSAFLVDLTKRTVVDSLSTGFAYTDLALVDNTTAYGVGSNGALYRLTINDDGTFNSAIAGFNGQQLTGLRQIAATNELPRSKYLIVASEDRIQRIELETNTISSDYATSSFPGTLSMVAPPVTGGFANHLVYNKTQTVASDSSSLPLAIRVFNQLGQPVGGIPVVFSIASGAGATLTMAQTTSNFEGYASTRVNIPSSLTTGTVQVNASIAEGARTEAFTITVGDPGLNPGGTPGGGTTTPPVSGLQIYQGHGQALPENTSTNSQEPIAVRLTDRQGNPIANAPITWRLASGEGSVSAFTPTTNENGIAIGRFTSTGLQPGVTQLLNAIVARADAQNQEVTFFVITIPRTNDGAGTISTALITPQDRTIRARAGETVRNAIQFQVSSSTNFYPLQYIGLRIANPLSVTDPAVMPAASCEGGYALSDATGRINCDLVVGSQTGTFALRVVIGGQVSFENFTLIVSAGEASRVVVVSGNGQSGNTGQQLSPLVVQVSDAANHTLAGVPVDWSFPSNVSVVGSYSRVTDEVGRASATIALPQTPGPVVVRVRAGAGEATFNLTANAVISQLTVSGGDAQSAVVNQPFAQPLAVKVVDPQGRAVSGASVTFTPTGSIMLASRTAVTNAEGIASTQVTAGGTAGSATVTAAIGAISVNFNLTVRLAGPVFTAADIVDGAGYQPGVAPGSIAYIRAAGIKSDPGTVVPGTMVGPLPTQLAGVEVLFGSVPAPIFSVSNLNGTESVVVQVPFETTPGATSVTIRTTTSSPTTVNNVQILPLKPGIYTFRDPNGNTYATATRPDGSYVGSANPARRGEIIRVYGTGLGQTMPATGTNRVGQVGQAVSAPVIAGVNNAGIRVVSAELLPGTVGVYMIAVEIPADTTPGMNQPFGFAVVGADGQAVFANGSALPVL